MTKRPIAMHLHFWADIRNTAGSVEKVISAFAGHGNQYEHVIACCPAGGTNGREYRHHGIRVLPFRESRLRNRVLNKMLGLGAFTYPHLVEIINREQPAVLHIHNRQEVVDLLVARLNYRPRVLVHYHRHFAQPVIPKLADQLIFISSATAKDILGKTNSKIQSCIVGNPLSQEICSRLKAPSPKTHNALPIILFGGGGNPIKGGAELIAAFQTLPPGSARLILAGRKIEQLPGLPSAAIDVIGEIPADKFFDLMQSVDIVAMPSYDEPFGLVAQEAMALGKLLVVSACGGLTEFTDDDCAIVIPPKNPEALVDGLQRALNLLKDASGLAHLLRNARQRIAAFEPDLVTGKLEDAYNDTPVESQHGRTGG